MQVLMRCQADAISCRPAEEGARLGEDGGEHLLGGWVGGEGGALAALACKGRRADGELRRHVMCVGAYCV